jgi:hypothetical protein
VVVGSQDQASFWRERVALADQLDCRAGVRRYAQQKYLESDFAKDWPEGMLDKINAL